MSRPLVVSYGGGVNSAAMLVGMKARGIRPDLILFADTGAEYPRTYESVAEWSSWSVRNGMPSIETVRVMGKHETLEAACLDNQTLPSIAYGFKTCSQRWKIEPSDKYMRHWLSVNGFEKYVKAIGIDASEPHRVRHYEDKRTVTWFPLVEWGWSRRACIEAIQAVGMPVPGKSSCFFCPSHKKSEVIRLYREHPELFDRAIQLERNAAEKATAVKGLGRNWSWEQLVQIDEAQQKLFNDVVPVPCMCFDGEGDDDE